MYATAKQATEAVSREQGNAAPAQGSAPHDQECSGPRASGTDCALPSIGCTSSVATTTGEMSAYPICGNAASAAEPSPRLQTTARPYIVPRVSTPNAEPAPIPCRYKDCKKTPKIGDGGILNVCTNHGCAHTIHTICLARLLGGFQAEEDHHAPVCGKRCFNAVVKQARLASAPQPDTKKRVRWDTDGPSTNLSSLSCLVDWMTTGDNYSRYRGGDKHHGESKIVIAGEISRFIASKGVTTERNAVDVMGKIRAIEDGFKDATDWLAATGQGIEDRGTIEAAVLQRCSLYYVLYDVLHESPRMQPLLTNKQPAFVNPDDEATAADCASVSDDEGGCDQSASGDCDQSAGGEPKSTKPLNVVGQSGRKRSKDSTEPHPAFIQLKRDQLEQERENKQMVIEEERDFKRAKLELREAEVDLKREEMRLNKARAATEAKETELRLQETAARTEKFVRRPVTGESKPTSIY